jgi:hypothetical protein
MINPFIKYRLVYTILFLVLFLIFIHYSGNCAARPIGCNTNERLADTTVTLVYADTLMVASFYDFSIPFNIQQGGKISAISLGFFFPQEYLEISGMEMPGGIQGFNYIVKDSLFRMAWSAIEPLVVEDHGLVISVKMRTGDLTGLDETIKLILEATSEFADDSANIIDGVVLEVPEIYSPDTNPGDTASGHYFRIYPNPFKEDPLIEFYLDGEYQVRITLTNANGEEIRQITDAIYQEGIHYIRLFSGDLAKGTYMLRFNYSGRDVSGSELIKIISIR